MILSSYQLQYSVKTKIIQALVFWIIDNQQTVKVRKDQVSHFLPIEFVVAGGFPKKTTSEILNLSTLNWRPGPDLPGERFYSKAVEFGDTFLIVGMALYSVTNWTDDDNMMMCHTFSLQVAMPRLGCTKTFWSMMLPMRLGSSGLST